jgi:murein DD-endopeptidase MepM/ murein hydrolase activator NlpD
VLLVRTGDSVEAGQEIARVGDTGRATAPHLHFEVRRRDTPQDPLQFLPSLK